MNVVLLAQAGPLTNIVAHALQQEFPRITVMIESSISRAQALPRRIRRFGIAAVAGQVLFNRLAKPLLRTAAASRIAVIQREFGLDDSELDCRVVDVPSVNSAAARRQLAELDPRVVVVNGTRIISTGTLNAISVPFINAHGGITPFYRGVCGSYWAFADGRPDLAGTTVHFVDRGVDTGAIIEQSRLEITPEDSFVTYPYLHAAAAVPMLVRAVRGIMAGTLHCSEFRSPQPAPIRSDPTIWAYVHARVSKGVR